MVELYFGQRVGYRVSAHPYFSKKFVLKGGGGGGGGWALTRYFTVVQIRDRSLKLLDRPDGYSTHKRQVPQNP